MAVVDRCHVALGEGDRVRGLKQAQASKLLGITQPRVGDLLRGRVGVFSADVLIGLLARLGLKVRCRNLDARKSRAEPAIFNSWSAPPWATESSDAEFLGGLPLTIAIEASPGGFSGSGAAAGAHGLMNAINNHI